MAVQRLDVGGRGGVLMAFPDAGCGGERQGFSWQSQSLVEDVGSGGCRWERGGFSWQFRTLVVEGESVVLISVSASGCRGERQRF